jgi:hypothetical protein
MKVKSTFFIPSLLLSTAFALSYGQFRADEKYIDFTAFKNLAQNIETISKTEKQKIELEDNTITLSIIKTIDKELSRNIRSYKQPKKIKNKKRHYDLPNTHIASKSEEINNSELIKLFKIKSEKKQFIKFDNEIIVDEVKVASSAPEIKSGPIEPVVESREITPEESVNVVEAVAADESAEMPMFDYSSVVPAKELKVSDKLYDRALSQTVKSVISREVGAHPNKLVDKQISRIEPKAVVQERVPASESPRPVAVEKKSKSEGFTADTIRMNDFQMSVYGFEISKNSSYPIKTFNFIPDYNREDRIDSDKEGNAILNLGLNEGVNTQTGIIEANEMVPTRVELNLSSQNQIRIPMITQVEAEKLYPGMNLLLLAIDNNVAGVEIDKSFSDKIYFDADFKKTEVHTDAHFVLFAGMKNGNLLLKYYLNNKETAQKVIYIGENEMFYDEARFQNGERDLYTFTTRNLMSSKNTDLAIAPELITIFNTNINAKKATLNSYELKMPTLISGSRKYLEMKHLSDSIFIGTDTKFEVDVPNNEFISKVLEVNQINTLKEHCVVQINISKELSGFTVNGKNQSGEMYTETSFLDADGNFSKADFDQAQKAFVVGDMEGLFNAKLEYSDGSFQFLKTYCSQGTYIVEQL